MNRILVVEDERAMAIALRDGLEYEGYKVSTAGDGEVTLSEGDIDGQTLVDGSGLQQQYSISLGLDF